jgi:hypothetical protein
MSLNTLLLTQIQIETIIGIRSMLGDAHINIKFNLKKRSTNGHPTIQFNQGFIHLPYILF